MSKVTMPETVGYQWLDTCHFRKKIPKGCNVSEFRGVVTTDQAEAYAAAKVRESQEWQPIETAPTGNNPDGAIFLMLAWGSDGDKSTGIGMRWRDKWFSAAVFFCLNQDRKYEFRETEIQPTHWRTIPPLPSE